MGAFLQGNELLLLLAVLLLILGPTKLPQLARGLGQAMREFKKASQGLYDEETVKQVKEVEKNKSSPNEVDAETLKKLAEKLGVSTEGKSDKELVAEVLSKAKEKGLI